MKIFMQKLLQGLIRLFSSFQSISLLLLRLVLAYGFYGPAINKLGNFDSIVMWFDDLHLPYPWIQAFLAATTESLGVIALALGLSTRFFAFALMIVMLVAIFLVHGLQTFEAAKNGFEIPLYYFLMLSVLMTFGPGKYSMDETFLKKYFGSFYGGGKPDVKGGK
jgi:putative oxidoreductase